VPCFKLSIEKLIEFAKELNCEIKALEIMPNHTHLFIQGNPTQSPNFIIAQIKIDHQMVV